VVRELAKARGARLVDAARVMNGRTDWFGDAIHFTDRGASEMAASISPVISGVCVRRVVCSSPAHTVEALSGSRAPR